MGAQASTFCKQKAPGSMEAMQAILEVGSPGDLHLVHRDIQSISCLGTWTVATSMQAAMSQKVKHVWNSSPLQASASLSEH